MLRPAVNSAAARASWSGGAECRIGGQLPVVAEDHVDRREDSDGDEASVDFSGSTADRVRGIPEVVAFDDCLLARL